MIAAERAAGIAPDPLRRLAALIPADPALAEQIAARLKLSNKARKRLSCAASANIDEAPQALAYRVGVDCAADRLLLAGRCDEAAAIEKWDVPRLPIAGGVLIARGLARGPVVAETLRRIERRWVEDGFPGGSELEEIVSEEVAAAI